jgi:hypothetical protein
LDGIPTPEEIRQEMAKNAEQNRVLRSLYRVSRRLSDRKRQTAETRQGGTPSTRTPTTPKPQDLQAQAAAKLRRAQEAAEAKGFKLQTAAELQAEQHKAQRGAKGVDDGNT